MKLPAKWSIVLILAATIVAFGFRLMRLGQRPMHADEAVQAVKFGKLLEEGFYLYDRQEYHGPTLNYLTLIPAWLSRADRLVEVSEVTLRIVPVFFGTLLVLLILLLVDGLGPVASVFAAVLTAVSPAFVFYSRYYIHEILLVFFTCAAIACGYRYAQSRHVAWALLCGLFIGLGQATKETFILVFGSMLLALILTLLMQRRQGVSGPLRRNAAKTGMLKAVKLRHVIIAVAVGCLVSVIFYSSFFANPQGVPDSLSTYIPYFNRAIQNQLHNHPWYYYLKMLILYRDTSGPVWSEVIIIVFAIAGFASVMKAKGLAGVNFHFLRFIAFYTAILTTVYSVIPYKTPWCTLGFLHGMILLAGVGAAALIKLSPKILPRALVGLLVVAGIAHLTWQGYLGSYKYYADPGNPYAYAHSTPDVVAIAQRVEQLSQVHPEGDKMKICVVFPNHNYWPLPWYLRRFEATRSVGWYGKIGDDLLPAPVIIASAGVEAALVRKLYELSLPGRKNLYVPLFDRCVELRPSVELRGYVTKDLWDRFRQRNRRSIPSQGKRRKNDSVTI